MASQERRARRADAQQSAFGIAEWYGHGFAQASLKQRIAFSSTWDTPVSQRPACPFQPGTPACSKRGGICSVQLVERDADTGDTRCGNVATVCPARFCQDNTVHRWVGEVLLGTGQPLILPEVPFLERTRPDAAARAVGKIDNILVAPRSDPLQWCALEFQAVYLSGCKTADALLLAGAATEPLPLFRSGSRRLLGRPDYRSSSVKRLMPQLQIKVPTISRWGKRMAVVVDEAFFNELGVMSYEDDVSLCDIAWFVVGYEENRKGMSLVPRHVKFTRLHESVLGLTAGKPATLDVFEARIRDRMRSAARP